MRKWNRLTISGNLTRDAELEYTPQNKTPICKFSIAHTPRYMRDGEWVDGKTSFLDCALFGDKAERAAGELVRGLAVTVEGRLQQETWKAKDGTNRSRHSCNVDWYSADKPRARDEGEEEGGEAVAAVSFTDPSAARAAAGDDSFYNS